MQTDLRAAWCPRVFVMDASPQGAALCMVEAPTCAVQELWRHSEQRGFYTRLEGPATAALREAGFESSLVYGSPHVPNGAGLFPLSRSLTEGILWDCCEVCRGAGAWSSAHAQAGLRVHDGFDIAGPRLRFMDLADNSVYRELLALALRRVVREYHAGPPCLTFGTLRRPRVRSKFAPAGFNPSDPLTSLHNLLARRVAMLFCIVSLTGFYFSVEQPGSSVMFRLQCFQRLLTMGACISRFCFCSFGSAFQKPSAWLHNKPWMMDLPVGCRCPNRGSHFVIEGTFTRESIVRFDAMRRPSALQVFERLPVPGESVASFSAMYPAPFTREIASGSLQASKGFARAVPLSKRLPSSGDMSGAVKTS